MQHDQYLHYSVSRHSVTALLSSFSDCGENAVVGDQECVLLSAVLLLRCNMLSGVNVPVISVLAGSIAEAPLVMICENNGLSAGV